MARKCPPGVVCIENVTLLLAIIVTAGVVWWVWVRPARAEHVHAPEPPGVSPVSWLQAGAPLNSCRNCPVVRATPACATTQGRSDVLLNPYAPPLRDSWPCGQPQPPGVPINIRTRGVEPAYRQVGVLTSLGGKEEILPLVGRPLEPRRDKWNFYTMAGNQAQVKLPVTSKGRNCTSEYGCDDLSTGDSVHVTGHKAPFRVTLYENDSPRYLPCAF